jgi:hypothetical protein
MVLIAKVYVLINGIRPKTNAIQRGWVGFPKCKGTKLNNTIPNSPEDKPGRPLTNAKHKPQKIKSQSYIEAQLVLDRISSREKTNRDKPGQ